MTIGQRIKDRRILLGLSVDDLAEKLGKNRATIYRYENGDIRDLPTSVLEPLALILQTTPADLMGYTSEPTEHNDTVNIALTIREKDLIFAYRASDQLTKDMVNRILNLEEPAAQDKMA